MIPCSGFIEEVLSVDADADAGRIVLAFPKNGTNCLPAFHACI